MLSLVCLLNFAASAICITFASIQLQIAEHFKVSDTASVFLTSIYSILFLPSLLLATYQLQIKGLKYSLVIGGSITALGSWLKVVSLFFSNPNYGVLLLGQGICAIAQSICLLAPMRVAADWFGVREKSMAMNFAVCSGTLGIATGLALPYEFERNGYLDYTSLFLLEATFITAIFLMIYQYYAENPSCAPTGTGEYRMSLSEMLLSHWSTLLFFGKPKDLLFLTVGFSLIYGALLAFNACLSQYLWKVAGISGDFAAVTGITNILVGFVVSSVVGMITGTLPHAKNAIVKALAVASAAGAFALAFCPYGVNQAHVVGLVCLPFGFAYGLVPCALDLAVEYTYPLAEEISAGLLYSAGGHIAFVSSVLLTHLLAGQKALWQGRLHPGTIYLLVQLVLGAGFLTYANGRCRRSEAEQR
ncbi:unnamed protein product, partial [Heterosigma akashiwo]